MTGNRWTTWAVFISAACIGPVAQESNSSAPAANELARPAATNATASRSSSIATPLPAVVNPFPAGLSGTLVFQSDIPGPDNPDARSHIYTIDVSNGRVAALTSGAAFRDETPRWSPDGQRIAFSSNRAHYEGLAPKRSQPDFDIYVMDADGGNVTRLKDDDSNDHDPSWTPDGKALVFSSDRNSRGDLYRLWLDDRRVQRLTHNFVGRAIMPDVSPDGRSVAFAAQSLQHAKFWLFQIHVLDFATGKTTDLAGAGGTCWPAWSPDGRALAHVLLAEEPSGLGRIEVSTGARQALLRDKKFWSYYPNWSKDGRQLAFSVSPEHHEGEDWDLALLDTSKPGEYVRLTMGLGNDRLPDWKP